MKIQILGTGCPKCQMLMANAEAAAEELGLTADFQKVDQLGDIARMGVLTTPALAVDGVVKSTGHLLSVHQIKAILQ